MVYLDFQKFFYKIPYQPSLKRLGEKAIDLLQTNSCFNKNQRNVNNVQLSQCKDGSTLFKILIKAKRVLNEMRKFADNS